ncbi:MAG: sigma-70 family RNA polymerase sigma factor [Clostridium sp.]|jgi:RNA polymerase sigma-70 factor (ECF subfamily)|uniref:sigma-70 family RNA polymerase sigma factor n=1 Tax=Clostridium sp. TaxID=1506 RepID=UPI0025B97DF9|nr:sigma-70 family RNA polymerase sigma factor [Clostridium sp.]MCH3963040.1 sigma-70 family RNA polymerase sigma factor [Clostridium sp.]MCI1716497.1 sigma-70 family RNA polymerase sigma factor [Clostridium sp.]MCI1800837.1 sigma-70 family RNA polymerase sigma factor [Clostridium sp.]MCI1814508.1 sigma-70 family RNA polymerase sigma factor [Clostridium sp.]MCI1871418.1 sigma-70 family RNA polymerase sigma factor [Clostridium sp.]
MNTEELVVKAKSGDENAFCELIKMNKETLYKTAYFYTKNKHDSLEILDDTVYKAYTSIKKLKQKKYFNTWIMRILINSSINYINKRKRLIFFGRTVDRTKEYKSVDNREEILDLYKAIDTLEGKFKMIIILRYFNDLTVKQIADIMNYPIGTVKTYIHKALKQLRIELEE